MKDGNIRDLPGQVRAVHRGGAALSPPVAIMMIQSIGTPPGSLQVEPLSHREIELLKLFGEGMRYKEAAEALSISAHTVHTHASRIYAKLGVANRKQEEFSLVIMDLRMPVMDGREATRRLRDCEAGPSGRTVPIIALTASVLPADRAAYARAGADHYLAKPIDRSELLAALDSFGLFVAQKPG